MNVATEIIKGTRITGVVAIMVLVSATSAKAAVLIDFLAAPASPTTPEFIWDGTALSSGPGSFGTGFAVLGPGDGESPPAGQSAPGLEVVTPFALAVPTGVVNPPAVSTTFYDATLDITVPFTASGPPIIVSGIYVAQSLSNGAFQIWTTDPTAAPDENQTLLLAGRVDGATISGILSSDTGAVLSAEVTYTGGAIYDAALVEFNSEGITGSFSWSLLDIDRPLSVTNDKLDPFEANGTGQFSGIGDPLIPEPATMSLLALGGMALLRRRRKTC